MNTSIDLAQSTKETVQKLVGQAQEFARRQPTQATAAAIGFALGLHLVPTRLLFRGVAMAANVLARPALLTLGALKGYEMYRASR